IKPLCAERFRQAIDRLEQFISIRKKADLYENHIGGSYIHIKEGHQETKVNLHEILYLEGLKDYTLIVTEEKKHCVLSNIGALLKEESFRHFVRIHRSFAVRKDQVKSVSSREVLLTNETTIPIGRSFRENVSHLLI